jgi:hypothetical protein
MKREKSNHASPSSRNNLFNLSPDYMARCLTRQGAEFGESAERIRNYRNLKVLILAYFAIFLISEYIASGEFYTNKSFFPEFIYYTIENSLFPASAYIFWIITPFVMIVAFVLWLGMLWPPQEFERFLVRRKNIKGLTWACIFMPIIYVGMLHAQDPSGTLYSIFQPLKHKIVFFLLYGGNAVIVSGALAVLVVDLRARSWLRKR